jgi:hypothetical protein
MSELGTYAVVLGIYGDDGRLPTTSFLLYRLKDFLQTDSLELGLLHICDCATVVGLDCLGSFILHSFLKPSIGRSSSVRASLPADAPFLRVCDSILSCCRPCQSVCVSYAKMTSFWSPGARLDDALVNASSGYPVAIFLGLPDLPEPTTSPSH